MKKRFCARDKRFKGVERARARQIMLLAILVLKFLILIRVEIPRQAVYAHGIHQDLGKIT